MARPRRRAISLALSSPMWISHKWVEAEWPCSTLEWASSEDGTRYLGMTVKQDADGSFVISQEGYILELIRSYSMENAIGPNFHVQKTGLWRRSSTLTTSAQRIVGEQLWLAMRTRPDIRYVLNFMSSQVSRQPLEVLCVGRRVLAYLQTTSNLAMKIESRRNTSSSSNTLNNPLASNSNDSRRNTSSSNNTLGKPPARSNRNVVYHAQERPELVGYSDASYAPYGGRSFGAAVITVDGFPVSWKAGKQSFVTLSVMESELYEASQTTLLLEHVGVLLDELCGERIKRTPRVDSTSAVAMLTGGAGSWRTRHLKVRSAYVREQVASGALDVQHVEGTLRLADLATKLHPQGRLLELLRLWSFQGSSLREGETELKAACLMCLVMALLAQPAKAVKETDSEPATRLQII